MIEFYKVRIVEKENLEPKNSVFGLVGDKVYNYNKHLGEWLECTYMNRDKLNSDKFDSQCYSFYPSKITSEEVDSLLGF